MNKAMESNVSQDPLYSSHILANTVTMAMSINCCGNKIVQRYAKYKLNLGYALLSPGVVAMVLYKDKLGYPR